MAVNEICKAITVHEEVQVITITPQLVQKEASVTKVLGT